MNGRFSLRHSKRGSERDIFFIVALILVFGIIALIGVKFVSMFNSKVQEMSSIPTAAKEVSNLIDTRMPKWLDGAFILLYAFLMIIAIVMALLVDSNPVMLPISILYMVFLVVFSRIAGIIWTKLSADSSIAAQAAGLPIMSFMMPKLHIFSFVIGMVILILMAVKRQ